MKSTERPLIYVILGTPHSGRRSILADLIGDGLGEGDSALTFLSENEVPSDFDRRVGEVRPWTWQDNAIAADVPTSLQDASEEEDATPSFSHVFFVLDGRQSPVDQMEAFKLWVTPLDVEFARAITVIDCTLASQHSELGAWFDACVHFSDIVLLARREGVANKWMSDFQAHYRDKFIPSLFEFVKDGKVKNPALVLEPQARRMTHIFDEDVDWAIARTLAPDAEIDFSTENEEGGEEDENEDSEGVPDVDPYFERRQNGYRVIEVPDVNKYLGSP